MRKGFVFSPNRCVDCGACIASCILENGWKFQPRSVYRINQDADLYSSVYSISMACNHCENPLCLAGCPSAAFSRDHGTNAVIINDEKCLGCNYCKWNCPYDAPKCASEGGLIGKCNLCLPTLNEGLEPACASACPTGALKYDTIPDFTKSIWPDISVQARFNPALEIRDEAGDSNLEIVPAGLFIHERPPLKKIEKSVSVEWSLIVFSFLSTLSVSLLIAAFPAGIIPDFRIILTLIILSGVFSLFHLKKKLRAWRSVLNISRSPLSREIAIYLLYLCITTGALISQAPAMILAAFGAGIALLAAIDSVYLFPETRNRMILHSGQAFITGLLMISFFGDLKYPFLFIAVIKLFSIIYNFFTAASVKTLPVLRYLRTAFLLISGTALMTGISYPGAEISIIFITGELIDRILFYFDFEPVNIKSVTQNQLIHKYSTNEKERN